MFPVPFNLNFIDDSNGFVIRGKEESANLGSSVSSAGDINGDGIDDIIVGAPYSGESYVIFGNTEGFSAEVKLTALDGSNGFVISSIHESGKLGSSVSGAGDINGDGFDDIIIGAPGVEKSVVQREYCDEACDISELHRIRGESYVIFGSDQNFAAEIDVASLDGSNGFVLRGEEDDESGASVSSAGDINGDGFDDIIIGAPNTGFDYGAIFYASGASYVVFGREKSFDAELDLDSLDGSNGFTLRGGRGDFAGSSVSSAGDINGDGIDDLVIVTSGSYYQATESYVLFGSKETFDAELDLTTLNGSNGFRIPHPSGGRNGQSFGVSDGAGDINGDGIDDLVVGVIDFYQGFREDPVYSTAHSYIIFGDEELTEAELDLNSLDGSNGFSIEGITQEINPFDITVSGLGDINEDGIDDFVIGVSDAGEPTQPDNFFESIRGDERGKSYVVFGRNEDFGENFNVNNLDGTNGFILDGIDKGDRSGASVSSVGDLNSDGINDLIIGAPDAEFCASNQGEAYVLFGSDSVEPIENKNRVIINSIAVEEGNEGNRESIFTVSLAEASDETITLDFSTEDGSAVAGEDYIANSGTLEFAPGETEKEITVTTIGDTEFERDESLNIRLDNFQNIEFFNGCGTATITNDDDFPSEPEPEPKEPTIELFRFRNTAYDTKTYIFVGEAERDFILNNENLSNIFALDDRAEDGTISPAFVASTVAREDLIPFFRLESLAIPGTFLFVSTAEYDFIFDDPVQSQQWKKQGFVDETDKSVDIPEFYLRDNSVGEGSQFYRFQNRQNKTFLYAGEAETQAIENNSELSSLLVNQGGAFRSL